MTLPAAPPVAVGLVAGWVADQLLGDPRRGHPVALLGSWAGWVETRTYANSRAAGVATEAIVLAPVLALGLAAGRLPAPARGGATAVLTWAALGGTSLGREGTAVHDLLAAGDLPGARARVRHLVGRVTDDLTADEVARAAVESVAENSSDAVVGTLVWGRSWGRSGWCCTAPPTPSMRCTATARSGTRASAGPPPASTTPWAGCRPG